ncbi:hypothetical protein WR25_10083 [Diploscapter pachys]|uniref:Clc-like protein n=1 Tax=Diploscapter pachys TaxID=2018661 RepID=A0A2A2LFB5_9BILA|nr:hypothetical protein WR25_10083 [Diploscapter pachys]
MNDRARASCCGKRQAFLTIFFLLSLFGFTFSLLSVLSPTWQWVSLENGRTEHHHGLWLDCKRDYSFDYGRTREYYETLFRRDLQGSPFAMFLYPSLQCVYKFDYYIDPEELYDHNHDENRINNDAYQHLFLGWKIAALVGVGVSVLFSLGSFVMCIFAFCHRIFICASTVLVTIAALLSTLGAGIFYGYANYQDNKVIREEDEDEIYEQTLGWAFYLCVVSTVLHWFLSVLGCCITSVAVNTKSIVQIQVLENDDESRLLSHSTSQPFKRSFSAIYKVDSSALRQWEHDCMRSVRQSKTNLTASNSNFKRTASVPNFTKKQARDKKGKSVEFSSSSNITVSTRDGGSNFALNQPSHAAGREPIPVPPPVPVTPAPALKPAIKTPQTERRELRQREEVTYEYMPCDSIGVSTFLGKRDTPQKPPPNDYDSVYEQIPADTYLQPNSLKRHMSTNKNRVLPATETSFHSSTQSMMPPKKTTLIDDVVSRSAFSLEERRLIENQRTITATTTTFNEPARPPSPPQVSASAPIYVPSPAPITSSMPISQFLFKPHDSPPRNSNVEELTINTFANRNTPQRRSLTNLTYQPGSSSKANEIFQRDDASSTTYGSSEKSGPITPAKLLINSKVKAMAALIDENDRSVGSSTLLDSETRDRETPADVAAYHTQIRLNLFVNNQIPQQDETTV